MTLIELFHETRNRYHYTHGVPPVRMRANRGMKEALWREMEQDGIASFIDNEGPYKYFASHFTLCGVHVNCDLPTNKPTFLAS